MDSEYQQGYKQGQLDMKDELPDEGQILDIIQEHTDQVNYPLAKAIYDRLKVFE